MDNLFMDDSSSEDEEERVYVAAATAGLKAGLQQIPNGDGTYRCPFCPTRNKQVLKYKELYDHAKGVATGVGTRGRKTGGQHRALFKFLQEELKPHAAPVAPRVVKLLQAAPRRVRAENRVVHPRVGLIFNLNTVGLDGRSLLPDPGEIREQFSHFHPEQVETFRAYNGPQGVAALIFGRDVKAYKNCRSFEESFLAVQRGRSDWERCKASGQEGTELYGWMAVEKDYYDAGKAGLFLRSQHNLKTMDEVVEEMKDTKQLQGMVDQLKETLSRADTENSRLSRSVEVAEQAKMEAQLEMRSLEEKNREERAALTAELQAVRVELQEVQEVHRQQVVQRAAELKELEEKVKALEVEKDGALKMVNALTAANRQAADQLSYAKKVAEQAKMEAELQTRLHREELEALRAELQEVQYRQQVMQPAAEVEHLKEKLKDVEGEKDSALDMVNDLTVAHREAVVELSDAKKEAVKVLQDVNEDIKAGIGVKRYGEIDESCWEDVGQAHFDYHPDWQIKLARIRSQWDDTIRRHDWTPFKKVHFNKERAKWEEEINPDDPRLKQLRDRFGDKPHNGIITALKEIQAHNPSGRFPVQAPWNYNAEPWPEGRAATLQEVVEHLGDMIETTKAENKNLHTYVTKLEGSGGTKGYRGKRSKKT